MMMNALSLKVEAVITVGAALHCASTYASLCALTQRLLRLRPVAQIISKGVNFLIFCCLSVYYLW
jgi:hypothetical protein